MRSEPKLSQDYALRLRVAMAGLGTILALIAKEVDAKVDARIGPTAHTGALSQRGLDDSGPLT